MLGPSVLKVLHEQIERALDFLEKSDYLGKEAWLGLDNIYHLTNTGTSMKLQITMEKFDNTTATVTYDDFRLTDRVL